MVICFDCIYHKNLTPNNPGGIKPPDFQHWHVCTHTQVCRPAIIDPVTGKPIYISTNEFGGQVINNTPCPQCRKVNRSGNCKLYVSKTEAKKKRKREVVDLKKGDKVMLKMAIRIQPEFKSDLNNEYIESYVVNAVRTLSNGDVQAQIEEWIHSDGWVRVDKLRKVEKYHDNNEEVPV